MAVFSALSCQSRDAATAPARITPLPADSTAHFKLNLPVGGVMTASTVELLAITGENLKAHSCAIAGPAWMMLSAGADSNAVWTVTPTASGTAQLVTTCRDARSQIISETDSLVVYNQPSVTPNISGLVPVNVGDSIDVTYDSSDTHAIDVVCRNCGASGSMARVGPNALRFYAQRVMVDTLTRGICFTVHGLDGRFTQQQCAGVVVMAAHAALYSVPQAIRNAEVVALHSIPVATYDKTGQSTHPDFMRITSSWSAGLCWLAYTPYANSNGGVENPSLATSRDCEHWTPAAGVRAPLIDQPTDGYNSDPELVYDAARGCLGVVFRQVKTRNSIVLTRTCDGTTFTSTRQLFDAPNHSAVSPTVSAGPDGVNRIWYVDAGTIGCASQTNVVKMRIATSVGTSLDSLQFGPEVKTDLVQPGWVIWHIKIRWIAEKKMYVAMYAAFPQTTGVGNCSLDDLYMATSSDGLQWQTYQSPVLDHLDNRFNFTTLYRASFQYDAATDNIRTIVAGINLIWGQFGVVHNFTKLMHALNLSVTLTQASRVAGPMLVRKQDKAARSVPVEDRP